MQKMEEALIKKATDLERKNRLITGFFDDVSHELKTPLSNVLAQLELMGLCLDDRQKMTELIAAATQNSHKLLRLMGNVLDIMRIDDGRLQVILFDADAVDLVQRICNISAAYAASKSIRLTFESSVIEKMMPMDVEKTERILLNLLCNAIKYTDTNGMISVQLIERTDEGIEISVEDNGVGIPEDRLSSLFDRFARVDSLLYKQAEGCGLGLPLVNSLVRMLGGTVGVNSCEGKGSCFTVVLPMLKSNIGNGIGVYDTNLSKKAEIELSDLNLKIHLPS
jgi:signal transduction histidine kinase